MASKQSDPYLDLLAAYFAFGFFVLLVVLVSPFFLAGVALVVAYRVFRAYQNSPARLARIAHQKSIALYDEARRLSSPARRDRWASSCEPSASLGQR